MVSAHESLKIFFYILLFCLCLILATVAFADTLVLDPLYLKEMRECGDGSMVIGVRFSIINSTAYRICDIEVEDYFIESASRGCIVKEDFGENPWGYLSQVPILPFKSFDYFDVVWTVGKTTLNRYYEGDEVLKFTITLSYRIKGGMEKKTWVFEYSKKEFEEVGVVE